MTADQTIAGGLAHRLEQTLLSVDTAGADHLLGEARNALSPAEVVDSVVVPALEKIGVYWERGQIALSQVYVAYRMCEPVVRSLVPSVRAHPGVGGTLAVAVLEDRHHLGKDLVVAALRSAGWDPADLGTLGVDGIVAAARSGRYRVLLVSALMLPAALAVRKVRDGLDASGVSVHLVVGGAPFRIDPELWREVGADACGRTAADAVSIVRRHLALTSPGATKP